MARALWSGSLSFGLVSVPVRLHSGVVDTDLHFRQLHASDHAPIEMRRFCAEEDEEVPYEEIASGYDGDDGEQVILTDAELATAAPRKTRTIDIEAFVDLADVDPIYFDHPYLLAPAGDSEGVLRAYRLLVEVMERTERAALGRFVLRTKEYLVLIRARGGRLKQEVDQAVALIEALACPWDLDRYEDGYQKRLKKIVREKSKGKTIEVPEEEKEPAPVPDLMAALEKTLAEIK